MNREALRLHRDLQGFGQRLHVLVRTFYTSPRMAEQGIARSFEQHHTSLNYLREALGMAKKVFTPSEWKGFVDVSLTGDHKAQLDSWDIADSDVWDGIASFGEAGLKMSVAFNKRNGSWVASFTGTEAAGSNSGWTVSAFGPDPYSACRVLLFKVSCILPPKWEDYTPSPTDRIG